MTTKKSGAPLRKPETPQQATFLELLFDLAFVVALFQLSHGLLRDLRWGVALQTLALLLAVWWVWFSTALLTDLVDPRSPRVEVTVIVTLIGTVALAAALPEAFGKGGMAFAGTLVATQIGRGLLGFALLGSQLRRRALLTLFWAAVSGAPLIAGALAHGIARGLLWVLAVAVAYTAAVFGYPAPGLGRDPLSESSIAGEHLAERYRQFLIIALGGVVLVTGLAASSSSAPDRGPALVVSMVIIVLHWRIYIYRAGDVLSAAIAAVTKPGRLAAWASYAHLVMVAGSVVTAVGTELVIAHPRGHSQPAWVVAILGGPALFLAGRAMLEYTVFARVSLDRLIGLLVLAALSPALLHLPPLLVALAVTAVLTGVAVVDAFRSRGRPRELPSPPITRLRRSGG